ncbi:MAG: helix-turn-helix transcriptional regulator [Proteobacteria bacterium]|nr:helix-turn-helix transcriptional regulator [Pseudomonadota bacterium]
MDVDALLAARVRDLRRDRDLTLEQLAALSGVSRSMISLIERQETSATAAVLNKLADALGISLPALFAGDARAADPDPVARRADQPVWTDPASGYVRRQLSPASVDSPVDLVEVTFPAGETVVFDNPVRRVGVQQQVWVIKGAMDITHEGRSWTLHVGDCMAMTLGDRITFHNPGSRPARYMLALVRGTGTTRRST